MNDNGNPQDEAVEKELAGVPEEMLDENAAEEGTFEDALDSLRGDLEKAQQEMLYAKAEGENIRRRAMEDVDKARKFALEKFSGELLAVIVVLGFVYLDQWQRR